MALALGALALASRLPEAPPAEVAVEVLGVAEAAPTVDLPLNALRAGPGEDTSSDPVETVDAESAAVVPSTVPAVVPSTVSVPASVVPVQTTVAPSTTIPPPTTRPVPSPETVVPPAASTSSTPSVETTTVAPISREAKALSLVRYDWQARFPNLRIDFLGPRNGLRALTYPGEHRIEIFVRDSDTAQSLHRVLAHELGHVIDVELNSPADRDRWLAQRGLAASTTWWPNESAPDFATGAGDFAEAFAVWETGVQTQSTIAAQPTTADIALLIELAS